ncbi:MAG: 30S ribosomal protein S13 [Candidatus Omnitrophica bacterium]|nr:30S ribosomal protein S13 [Candidatus Omnitrophota bacterium]
MARIVGIDLPAQKKVHVGLTYIYGIGPTIAKRILNETGIDGNKRIKDLTDKEVSDIATVLQKSVKTEGDLRREVTQNIKRLMDIGCYRGLRHRRGLPVRGQRTHTNARTRKGPVKQTIAKKKVATKK